MEEDCVNIPPSEENTEGSANDMASTSDQNMENMEEDCGNNMPSTSEQKVEVSVNIASTSEQNMEEDCGNNIPSTSEQNMEVSVNIASTSEQNMEEDCVDSTASTSEQNMDLGPGSDLECCSNCKAGLNYNEKEGCVSKVRISTLIDAKTANILFPHLPASDFLCTECVTMVVSKTKFSGVNKKRTWAGSGSSSVDSTPPPSKQDKTKGTVVGGGVPSLPPAPTSKQNTEGSRRYVRYATSDLERCSNCKAWLNCNEKEGCVSKVRVSSLIDAETAKILFPHLKPSEFLCTECVKDGTWSGRGSSSVDSTRPPSKRHKAKGTVGGGGVPSLPPAPTSTQNTEGSIRNVVIPKGILSVAPSKQNEGSVNVIKPCRPNMNRVTVIGPSASMLNVASSVNKPSEQNMGASVKAPSTSKPNVKGTVKVPLAFLPNMKGSPQYVVVPRLPTVLPTNWSVKDSANNNDMPSTSEQSAEGSGSKIIRCSLCKKELKYDAKKSLPRIRISTLVDLQTAQVLLPHLSPEDFICKDTCEKWVYSKTMPCAYNKNKRTCTVPTVLPTNRNVKDSGDNDMPCPSEQSTEGSGSDSVRRCSLCKKELIPDKKHKSLARTRISTLVDLKTAQVLLPHLSPEEFICRNPCQKWLHSKTKPMPRNKNKRTWTGFSLKKYPLPYKKMRMDHDSTNTESVSTSDGPSPPPKKKVGKVNQKMMMDRDSTNSKSDGPSPAPKKKVGKVNQVIHYLKGSKYVSAFRRLLEIPAAAAAFNKVFQDIIRKERIKMNRDQEGPFSKQLTPENLASFSWKETNEWVEEKAPLTLTCLRSMFPQAKKITGQHRVCNTKKEPRRFMTEEEAQQLVDKRIAMAMSIVLFTGNSKHTFVQSLIGVEMWREGCPQKMFKIMNSFGVSLSRVTSMNHIVRLQDDHDKEVKLWKGQVEKELRWIYAVHGKRKSGFKGQANQVPAFSLTWDRVKIASHAKHERLGGNKPTIWAFRFAHRNRIPFSYLQGPPKKAVEVSPGSILPSKQTYEALRQRMKTIVMRIIVDNLTALEGLRSKVVWHIPHVYSKQMKEKSNVVNLGAVPVASSTTEGDTEIMDGLIEYVPTLLKKPHKVLCCSDGLNINTTEESSESTAQQRFEGLVDAPPEYPKEFLCYQDIMKMLSSEKSLEARGSLSQLKSVFAVRGLSIDGKVKETILRVWGVDFITFVTSAYITLYAATECNLDAVDGQPSDFPTDAEAQMEWLSGLSHRLVDLVWMPPPQEDINTAAATACLSEVERKEVCFCGEEKTGETLVQCCSNLCGGVWFHEGCAPIDPTTDPTVTQDWFCSPACQGDGTYIYCHCKEQRGGQMVQCALMDQCRRHEWYHKDCLSLSEQGNADSEEPAWYCSEMCVNASDADDHVLNYTKALVWEGLYNMARRDAIKEGDGEAMTDFWKMDMVLFWARKHLKDFTTCHRLLTGIEGFYPEEIRQDLKWNRVANLEGKPGCNISLDLVNEFMNIEFKESLGHVSDHYSNERMELCGMMAGAIGRKANRLLITLGAGNGSGLTTSLASSHVYKTRRRADIAKFVAEYKKDHLFRYIPGRAHEGFEKFTYQQKIKTPKKMGKTMRNLAQDMDLQS